MKRRTLLGLIGGTGIGAIVTAGAGLSYLALQDTESTTDGPSEPADEPQPVNQNVENEPTPYPTPTPTSTATPPPAPRPDHLGGLSAEYLPPTSTDGYHDLGFTQQVRGVTTEFSVQIPKASYQYYSGLPRVGDYGTYISHDTDDDEIARIADTFDQYGNENGLSPSEVVNHVLAWVQGMEYTQDQPTTGYNEYPKYPTEMLVDKGSDCEDTCILLASVLQQLGFGAVLLIFTDAQHMAVGIAGEDEVQGTYYDYKGQRFYYVETTGDGWRVGQMPPDVQEQTTGAEIRELNNSPAFGVNWNSNAPASGGLEVTGNVHNLGDAAANGITVRTRVKGQNNVLAQATDSMATCPPDNTVNFQAQLSPPAETEAKIQVDVISNRFIQVSSESEFQSP